MAIVDSSEPGLVEHDRAIWLLQARAVMTTAVCRELDEGDALFNRRAFIALYLLRTWVRDELGYKGEPEDGLPATFEDGAGEGPADMMTVPADGQLLLREIVAGVAVCKRLRMLWTADTQTEVESDSAKLEEALCAWRTARDSGYEPSVDAAATALSDDPLLRKPNLLYMVEHAGLRIRKVGVTSAVRLETWRRRGWATLGIREYPDAASLHAAEAMAIERLDRLNARSSRLMAGLFANLARDGRTEMYDPKCFSGSLDHLLSEGLGKDLAKRPATVPLWISEPRRAAAYKAWSHPARDGAAAAKKAVATRNSKGESVASQDP